MSDENMNSKNMISWEYLKDAGLRDDGSITLDKEFVDSTTELLTTEVGEQELLNRSNKTQKKKVLIMLEFNLIDDTEFRKQYEKMFKLLESNEYKIIEFLEK